MTSVLAVNVDWCPFIHCEDIYSATLPLCQALRYAGDTRTEEWVTSPLGVRSRIGQDQCSRASVLGPVVVRGDREERCPGIVEGFPRDKTLDYNVE